MGRNRNRFPILLLPALAALYAAAPAAGQTALSLHAGVTSADLTAGGRNDRSDGPRRALSLGAGLTLPVLPGVGLYLGGAYLQKGASYGILADDIVNAFFADLKLDYVELSALARVGIPAGFASLYVLAGPTVALQASCVTDLTYSLGGDIVESDSGIDYSDVACTERDYEIGASDSEEIEFGAVGGVGAQLPLVGPIHMSLEALYSAGMSAIFQDARNRTVHVRAGLSLPID